MADEVKVISWSLFCRWHNLSVSWRSRRVSFLHRLLQWSEFLLLRLLQ